MCEAYPKFNCHEAIDYFIKERDVINFSELVGFTMGEIDQDYLIDSLLATKNKKFIEYVLNESGHTLAANLYLDKVQKLIDYIK